MNVLLLLVFCIYSGFAIMAVEMTIFFVNAGRACIEDQSMYALQPLECIRGLILHTGSVGVE